MKKSLAVITISLVLFFLFCQNVLAALLPVTPKCEIEASIIDAHKEITKPTEYYAGNETMYSLELEITKIGKMISGGWTNQTCENSFNVGQVIEVSVFKERDLRNQTDELKKGQIISFHVQGVRDEFSEEPWFQIDGVKDWNAGIIIIKDVEKNPENKISYKNNNPLFFIIPIFVVIVFVILYSIYIKRKNSSE